MNKLKMNKLIELNELIYRLRRNYPMYPSTFGYCSTDGCDNSARGSGKCASCCEKAIGELIDNPDLARSFMQQTECTANIQRKMLDIVENEND